MSEKETTPRAASSVRCGGAVRPRVRSRAGAGWARRSRPAGPLTAIVSSAVALSCALMNERSSVAELADSLRGELDRYSPGEKLPSSRPLVERYRVSPVTVSRALAALAAEGLVVTRPGAGAFRAAPRRPTRPRPGTPPGRRSR